MAQLPAGFNPFANIDLHVPNAYRELVTELQSNDDLGDESDVAPFRRMVDVWFYAMCLGAKENLCNELAPDRYHKFVTGQVLQNNSTIIEFLLANAIAHTDDPFVIEDPRRVVAIADGYAAGGLGFLEEQYKGQGSALLNISRSLIQEFPYTEETSGDL